MLNDQIRRIVEESAARHAAHVVDIVIRGSKQKAIVEVYIDAESGVTSDLCSAVSRNVAESFDAANLIHAAYDLIVSSPGIERPLKFRWQYEKHIGRKLAVTHRAGEMTQQHTGKLLSVNEEGVVIEIGKEQLQVRFDAMEEAIVKAPW